ncbi:MAG: prenyltransferase/squalene oxidase repeat-containing protein [Dermatophilaceae bacterium]
MTLRPSPPARIGAVAALALAIALVSAGCTATPAAPPSSSTPKPTTSTISPTAAHAAAYVVGHLKDGDHVEGKFGADLGQTSDVALGLAATGGQPAALTKVLAYLEGHGAGYVHGDPSTGEKVGAHYAGPTGKLALMAQIAGKNPASFAGLDLTAEVRALMDSKGRFRDDSKFGDFSNPLGQAFDILALQRGTADGAPQVAIDYLLTAQCKDGGFAETFPKAGAKCDSSPDATGLALQALVAVGAGCPAVQARTWLMANQQPDGSFVSSAVDPSKPAAAVSGDKPANVNSTAYAALGLVAGGQSTSKIVSYLSSVQNLDGGLAVSPGSSDKASNVYASAQALDAFAGSSFLTAGPSPIKAAALVCAQATTGT